MKEYKIVLIISLLMIVFFSCKNEIKIQEESINITKQEKKEVNYKQEKDINNTTDVNLKELKTPTKQEKKEVKIIKKHNQEKIAKTKELSDDKEKVTVKEMIIKEVVDVNQNNSSKNNNDIPIIEVVKKDKPVEVIKETPKEVIISKAKQNLVPVIIKVNTQEFSNKITGKKVQLIDVRTPREFISGHIKDAKNINIYDSDFITKATSLDKSKPVYVYCRSGVRSMKSAKILKMAGYKVYNLNGGILRWKSQGNQIVK